MYQAQSHTVRKNTTDSQMQSQKLCKTKNAQMHQINYATEKCCRNKNIAEEKKIQTLETNVEEKWQKHKAATKKKFCKFTIQN